MSVSSKILDPQQHFHNLRQVAEEDEARNRRIAMRRKPRGRFARLWVTLLVWPSVIAFGFIFTGLGWTEFAKLLTTFAN